jgi:hypothetical protein
MKQKTNSKRKSLVRTILMSLILLGLTSVTSAQFQYGIKLGVGAACQSDLLEIANNCDMRFAPSIGLIGKYHFTEGFALKTGLEYQQKGRSFDEDGVSLTNKLQYLNVPLKAELSAGENAGFKNGQRIYFAVGPYLGYLLDAEAELNNVSFDLKSDSKDFDFGLGFEIGMELPVFSEKALQIGLNYDMGFVEIYKSDPDLHNKMASFNLGFLF